MTQKQRVFRKKGRKPSWGVLAQERSTRAFPKLNAFISSLQVQYQAACLQGRTRPI